MPSISLGTVYRNLRLLKETGNILELDFSAGPSRFDANGRDHCHLRCEKCGSIFDVAEPVDKRIEDRVAKKTGFKVTHHRLELSGLCRDCQLSIGKGEERKGGV